MIFWYMLLLSASQSTFANIQYDESTKCILQNTYQSLVQTVWI